MLKWIDARVEALEDIIEAYPGWSMLCGFIGFFVLALVGVMISSWAIGKLGGEYAVYVLSAFMTLAITCAAVLFKAVLSFSRRGDYAHRAKYIMKRPK